MRAINLVPADARTGGVSSGKSGGGHLVFLGVLAVMIACASLYANYKGKEATANKDLQTVQSSAAAYDQVATQYSSFQSAAADAQQRISVVKSLADARFDWAGSLRDLARLVPESVTISQLDASVSSASGGGASQFRGQIASPAITLSGCTPSQNTAADLVTQLQAMRRVTNVTLEYSKQSATAGSGSGDAAATAGTCSGYTFAIDVFFAPGSAQDSADAVPSTTPATAQTVSSTTPTTPGATTPAATTPSTSGN